MSDPTAATGSPAPRTQHHRKISNYLLDKRLQLRYVVLVSVLSAVIAATLGYMIYHQHRVASESIEGDLKVLTQADPSKEFQEQVTSGLESDDQMLVYKMVIVGFGLVVILSAYLVIMTHKVAGPLFKVSMYFERMAEGRLGPVTPLRRGDMLQDFFGDFKAMHESLRSRAIAEVELLDRVAATLRGSHNEADYRGAARARLADAIDGLERHIARRKNQLA